MDQHKKIFLFDGMNLIYRFYFALQKMITKEGRPIGAVYGLAQEILRLTKKYHPDYLAMCLESEGKTFRHEIFPEYKAHRPARPQDLDAQMPYVYWLCEALNIPVMRIEGHEADDTIGTLATTAKAAGVRTVIVSNDKDLLQLVNQDTVVYRKGTFYNRVKVEEAMGVRPDQIVHLLGLMGDTTDNIPGAPGVGEKGALEIVKQMETIPNAIANYWKIKNKRQYNAVRKNKELILKCLDLVTIRTNLPLEASLEDLAAKTPDADKLRELFSDLGFEKLLKEFGFSSTEPVR
jgi:DNA polymerase-1